MPLDMPPPPLETPPALSVRPIDAEYEFEQTAKFLGSDPEDVTFERGDVDLLMGVEFAGASYDPLTMISAFIAWIQLRGSFDIGITKGSDISVGLGAEVFYGQPFIHQDVVEWRTSEEEPVEWRNMETGLIPRLTLHLQEVNFVDLYAVVFCGPTFGQVTAELDTREATMMYRSPGLRWGAGVGGNLVAKYGILIGGELRYQAGVRLIKGDDLPLVNTLNETVGELDIERRQRAPRGFSWVFNIGIRL